MSKSSLNTQEITGVVKVPSLIYLLVLLLIFSSTTQTGFLVKQARGTAKNWKKRYFILNDNTFTYFTDEKSLKSPKGDIILVDETTVEDENIKGWPFAFRVTTPFEDSKSLLVAASSEEERTEWKAAILKAIELVANSLRGYMIKKGSSMEGLKRKFFIYTDNRLTMHADHEHTTQTLAYIKVSAATKVAQDLICYVYHKSYNLNTIRLRTFNHEGPRRERYFGIASYAYQIAKIKQGLQEKVIRGGHIDDKRNFTHVKDIVDAYLVAMEKAIPGKLYVVGSENENNVATFREVLNTLIYKSKLSGIEVKEVAEYVRPTNVPYLIGDTSEFRNETGWTPQIGLDEMLDSIQSYWDDRVLKHPNM
jgi:hypothetical protein